MNSILPRTLIALLLSLVAFGTVACDTTEPAEECLDSAGEACDPENDEDCTCEEVTSTECSPDTDANCVCTDDTGATCEEGSDGCTCEVPNTNSSSCEAGTGEVCICTDGAGASCEEGSDGCTCEAQSAYRFVLVEDLTQNASGSSPGADLDAVTVAKADGTVMPATSVEDFGGIGAGDFADPQQAIGLPDSDCEVKNFVALGGAEAGGYIVLGFADGDNDGSFTKGSAITVHEIGSTMCPEESYDDDPYKLSISVSKDINTFVEIATNVLGNNPITVP